MATEAERRRARRRPRPLRRLHINRMIPNILTLLALAFGLSAVRFALQERWEHAVLAILVAGVLDGLDGRVARILQGTSRFGAELDSLSDFLCFGVIPSLVLYLWALEDIGRFGWSLVLLQSICCALRLARFNTDLDREEPAWSSSYFVGVPSPAAAATALIPMLLWFQFDADVVRHPVFVGAFMLAASLLMVSRLRTFSFKHVRLSHSLILPTMLGVALYLAALWSFPWLILAATQAAYLATIPFSVRQFRRHQARQEPEEAPSS